METTNILPAKVQELKDQGQKMFAYTSDKEEVFYFKKPNKTDILFFQNEVSSNTSTPLIPVEKFIRKLFCGENVEAFVQYIEEKPLAINNILEHAIKDMFDQNFTVNDI